MLIPTTLRGYNNIQLTHDVLLSSLKGQEILYDMRHDRIGDAIGASALMDYVVNKYDVKISVVTDKKDRRLEYSWLPGIDLFEWIPFKPYRIYDTSNYSNLSQSLLNKVINFSIWNQLRELNIYPKMKPPERLLKIFKKPEGKFISLHVINAVGIRCGEYVQRRILSMEKYERIALELCKRGWKVNRLGIAYDAVRSFKEPVIDYTPWNIPLEQSFIHLSHSSLFLGGDTGLKHASSALGIPMLIETDDHSKRDSNPGRPDLLTDIPYNCSFEEHMNILNNHPIIKEI
jgi:ADP-heptose:LPS heptosyltransferase